MIIALAQVRPEKGDITANIDRHKRFVGKAITRGAGAVFFPELSITGYEPNLADTLATTADDAQFAILQQISDWYQVTIGIGAPTRATDGIQISLLLFQPGQPPQTYAKQQLHPDELPYFVPGHEQRLLALGGQRIAPAICYESLQTSHAEQAVQLGATIYVACVAKSQNGIDKAMTHYPMIARRFGMPVLMVNCVGFCDTYEAAGQSGVWASDGTLLAQLGPDQEGFLFFDTETNTTVGLKG